MQPVDPVEMVRLITEAIRAKFAALPHIGPVHTRDRFAENEEEDLNFFTTPDPTVGDRRPITNTIEISLPGWGEGPYTSERSTSVTFHFPIKYSLGVTDVWDKPGYEFGSSAEQFLATCMRARLAFKEDRQLGLGPNVFHGYLQGGVPSFATNDKGESTEHVIEMSLDVTVEGIKV